MTTHRKTFCLLLVCLLATALASPATKAQKGPDFEHILIEVSGTGDQIREAIRMQGGRITAELPYADAIAVDVPSNSLDQLGIKLGRHQFQKMSSFLDHAMSLPLGFAASEQIRLAL